MRNWLRAARLRAPPDAYFDDNDLGILEKAGRDTGLLVALNRELARKDITIERLIRIAGPLRGTSLASRRLDRVVSVALNAFEPVPALAVSSAYVLFKTVLLGFVKTKADPQRLPGLKAMMPTSPIIKIQNRPDVAVGGDLHIIASDNEDDGVFSKLRNLALDLFFQDENNFVVNYASMSKGGRRRSASVLTPIISPDITHYSYFRS